MIVLVLVRIREPHHPGLERLRRVVIRVAVVGDERAQRGEEGRGREVVVRV
jgi:hypothetical protein